MSIEPRTHIDMMRDLLSIVEESQWEKNAIYMGNGDYADGCVICGASDELTVYEERTKTGKCYERNTHKEDCWTDKLIKEVEAYLRAEDLKTESGLLLLRLGLDFLHLLGRNRPGANQ